MDQFRVNVIFELFMLKCMIKATKESRVCRENVQHWHILNISIVGGISSWLQYP